MPTNCVNDYFNVTAIEYVTADDRQAKKKEKSIQIQMFATEVHLNPRDFDPMNTPCFVNKHFSFQLEYCSPLFFSLHKFYRMQVNECARNTYI